MVTLGYGRYLSKADDAADGVIDFFHGTSKARGDAIRQGGIDLSQAASKADFGAGFYTTTNLRQASEWAAKRFGDSADVLHFSVSRRELAKFSSKSFGPGQIDEAFAMYKVGRSGGKHGYDVMSGPMLRNPIPFMRGAAAVMKGQQTSFHTQSVIDLLNGSLVR